MAVLAVLAGPSGAQDPPKKTPPAPSQEIPPVDETKPKPPPKPPEGILPLGEIARFTYAPSDRPLVFLHGNQLVMVTSAGSVEAHDAGTGEFRWKLGLPGEALFGPVVFRSDRAEILLSSAAGRLYVVAAETGEIRREIPLPFELATAPLVDLSTVYLGSRSGQVAAFDAEAGAERFRVDIGESPSALAVSGGVLIVSGSERTLLSLDARRGAEMWRLAGRRGFRAPAVFQEDRLYIGNDAGEFYCLDLSDGDSCFRWPTGASILFPALVEERLVFVTSFGNDLYAYQARGGTERYRVSLPGRPASGPVRFGRRLVVATYDGAIVEVDPQKGAVGKVYAAPGELASPPAFLPGLPSAEGEWYKAHRIALSLRTGEVLLLGHQPGEAEEKEKEETGTEEPRPPPNLDTLSWK